MCITYTPDTGSLSFWLILYDSWPIFRQCTNGQHIGRVLGIILTEISANSRSICRPTLSRYLSRYLDWYILVNISAKWRLICRLTYQLSVGRYVDGYIGQVSVDMSIDTLVEGCTNYTWSKCSLLSGHLLCFSLSKCCTFLSREEEPVDFCLFLSCPEVWLFFELWANK